MRLATAELIEVGVSDREVARQEFILPVVFDNDQERDQVLVACSEAISS